MYKIGELSKIVDIPIKTLRYYDEVGILPPAHIDQFTGYRYYDDESILNIEMIKSLKSVNFTLQEIKEYMINKDDKLFLNKQDEIKKEIRFLEERYRKLSIMIKKEQNEKVKVRSLLPKELDTNKERKERRYYEKRKFRDYL